MSVSSAVGASSVAALSVSSAVGASFVCSSLETSCSLVTISFVLSWSTICFSVDVCFSIASSDWPSSFKLFDCDCTELFCCSSAFASSPIPKSKVAPTKREAVPTVNFLIEYLLSLLGIKSNFTPFFFFINLVCLPSIL